MPYKHLHSCSNFDFIFCKYLHQHNKNHKNKSICINIKFDTDYFRISKTRQNPKPPKSACLQKSVSISVNNKWGEMIHSRLPRQDNPLTHTHCVWNEFCKYAYKHIYKCDSVCVPLSCISTERKSYELFIKMNP